MCSKEGAAEQTNEWGRKKDQKREKQIFQPQI